MSKRTFKRGERARFWFAGVVVTSYVLRVSNGHLDVLTPRGRRVTLPASRCWKPGDRPGVDPEKDTDE